MISSNQGARTSDQKISKKKSKIGTKGQQKSSNQINPCEIIRTQLKRSLKLDKNKR